MAEQTNTKPLNLEDELRAAQWALTRIYLIVGALCFLAIVLLSNDWIIGLLLFLPAGWLFFSVRPHLIEQLHFRKQYLYFAQLTENIAIFSDAPGDDKVVGARQYALAWLQTTGNTNVKVISGIYEDTRWFVHWIDGRNSVQSRSYERLPADFRCAWERFEETCMEFKNKIDRSLIEDHRRKDDEWVDTYMMNQLTDEEIKNLIQGRW